MKMDSKIPRNRLFRSLNSLSLINTLLYPVYTSPVYLLIRPQGFMSYLQLTLFAGNRNKQNIPVNILKSELENLLLPLEKMDHFLLQHFILTHFKI